MKTKKKYHRELYILCIAPIIVLFFLISMSCRVFATNNSVTVDSEVQREDGVIDIDGGYAELSLCDGVEIFKDREEIEVIAEEYNLGDPNIIDEIRYVPLVGQDELKANDRQTDNQAKDPKKSCSSKGSKYYVKKKKTGEKQGSLIRSSWYRYPGGSMTISESLSRTYSFNAEAGVSVDAEVVKASLKTAYGFSVTGTESVSDTQQVTVKKGHKRNVKAYQNLKFYNYELWKKRFILGDKFCGKGKVNRPIGVIFVIGKNVKV